MGKARLLLVVLAVFMTNISSSNAVQVDLSGDKLQQYFLILERYVLPFLVVATIVLLCGYIASRIFNRRQRRHADETEIQVPKATPEEGTAAFLRELKTSPPIKDPENTDAPQFEASRRRNIGQEFREPKFSIGPSGGYVRAEQEDHDEKPPLLLQVTAAAERDEASPADETDSDEQSGGAYVAVGRWDDPAPAEPNGDDRSAASDSFSLDRSMDDHDDDTPSVEPFEASNGEETPARLSGWSASAPLVTSAIDRFGSDDSLSRSDDAEADDTYPETEPDGSSMDLSETVRLDDASDLAEDSVAANYDAEYSLADRLDAAPVDDIDEAVADDLLADEDQVVEEVQAIIDEEALTLVDAASNDDTPAPVDFATDESPIPEPVDGRDAYGFDDSDAAVPNFSEADPDDSYTDQWDVRDREELAGTSAEADDEDAPARLESVDDGDDVEPLSRDEAPRPNEADVPAMLLSDEAVVEEPAESEDIAAPSAEQPSFADAEPEGAVVHPLPGTTEPSIDAPTGADWDKAYAALCDLMDDLDHAATQVQGNIELVSGFERAKSELSVEDIQKLRVSGLDLLDDLANELAVLGEGVGEELAEGCARANDFNRVVARLEQMAEDEPLDEGWNELIVAHLSKTQESLERVKKTIASVVPLDERDGEPDSDLGGSDPAVSSATSRRFPFGRKRG